MEKPELDQDMLDLYMEAESSWWSDPEVHAALIMLRKKQLEYVEKAGMNARSLSDWSDFEGDLWNHTRDTNPEDVSAYTAIWYNNDF